MKDFDNASSALGNLSKEKGDKNYENLSLISQIQFVRDGMYLVCSKIIEKDKTNKIRYQYFNIDDGGGQKDGNTSESSKGGAKDIKFGNF